MKTLYNPFGGADEQAMVEQFYTLHSRGIAEDLDRIYRNNRYSKDWTVFALREGFSKTEIQDFKY